MKCYFYSIKTVTLKKRLILLLLLSEIHVFGQNATGIFPGKELDTARLNAIARLASKEDRSWNKVAHLIGDSCQTDLEKVYTIYTYIGGYYKYDLNRLKLIHKREIKRELYLSEVINKKKGVCGDFANLFVTLCDSLDIGCYRVSGYGRTFSILHPIRKSHYNHSWNVVRIEGKWYPVDVTFGMQHFTKKKLDKEAINYDFLCTDPSRFGIVHLPADPLFQLVQQERSYKDFRYRLFLPRVPTGETSKNDELLSARLKKDWKDQLIEEAVAAEKFNPKVKGASLKLLEVRINKVIDKKTKRRQRLTRKDYEDAIYLYNGILSSLHANHAKKKFIRYANYRILKLTQERDKLKK